eukprot:3182214-Alexandrium_andersonii.AAC.1
MRAATQSAPKGRTKYASGEAPNEENEDPSASSSAAQGDRGAGPALAAPVAERAALGLRRLLRARFSRALA